MDGKPDGRLVEAAHPAGEEFRCLTKTQKMKKGDKSKVNSMIEAFGERYLVLNHDGGYLLYDKERKSPRTNALFMGKFYISTNGDSYVYNEDRFSSVSDLVKRMEAHNSSLPFS